MIIEGTNRTGDVRDRADVVVVGTGAGGGTLAAYLSDRGRDVVMVDRGGFFRAEDFHQREREAMGEFNGRRGLDTSDDNAAVASAEPSANCEPPLNPKVPAPLTSKLFIMLRAMFAPNLMLCAPLLQTIVPRYW